MAFLWRTKQRVPDPAECIKDLAFCSDLLHKRQLRLEKLCAETAANVRRLAVTNRKLALYELRRRHLIERDIFRLVNIRFTVEQQKQEIENAQIYKIVISSMSAAAQLLKQISGDGVVVEAERVIDQLRDFSDNANSVSESLAQPIGGADCSDDELERELDELLAKDGGPPPAVGAESEPEPEPRLCAAAAPSPPDQTPLPAPSSFAQPAGVRSRAPAAVAF